MNCSDLLDHSISANPNSVRIESPPPSSRCAALVLEIWRRGSALRDKQSKQFCADLAAFPVRRCVGI
jgi:hypothetical protein